MASLVQDFRSSQVAARKSRTSLITRTLRTAHLVLGLSFGLLLVAQGLSGAALVWRPELDRLMVPALTHTTAPANATGKSLPKGAQLDTELQAVQALAPGGQVRMVRLPAATDGTDEWMVQLPASSTSAGAGAGGRAGEGPRWTVYTSPASGQVLGVRGAHRDALQFLIELHHNLLWGRTGRAVQGYLAIATILLALSGLYLWWPARWTPSRFRPRAAARPLHYALGFWAMWPLLLISITATYFVWREPIQRAFGVADPPRVRLGNGSGDAKDAGTPQGKRKHGQHSEGGGAGTDRTRGLTSPASPDRGSAPSQLPAITLARVVAAAQAAQPDARLTAVRLPERRGPYTVQFQSAREHYRAAPNAMTVAVSPDGTPTVVKTAWWGDLPARRRFLEWLPRLHQGEFGGPLIRLIWSLTGLVPAMLYVSGFLMWRRRLRIAG